MAEVSSEALFRAASKICKAPAALPWANSTALGIGKDLATAEAEFKSECTLNCSAIGLEIRHLCYSEFSPVYLCSTQMTMWQRKNLSW